MIKITEAKSILKYCNSCGSSENTKIIEISNGGNGAIMICLCDECQTKLIGEIVAAKHKGGAI